jgi:hypothetical protein
MSSGFSESSGGHELERELVRAARGSQGARYRPELPWRLFSAGARNVYRADDGRGGPGRHCLSERRFRRRHHSPRPESSGVRFSGLVTVGNCADVRPHELLEYFLASPETSRSSDSTSKGAGDGRQLFEALRAAKGQEARRDPERRAHRPGAPSGRLAYRRAGRQRQRLESLGRADRRCSGRGARHVSGCTLLGVSVSCRLATPRRSARCCSGMVAAPACWVPTRSRVAGFDVAPFAPGVAAKLQALKLPAGSSVLNPDRSARRRAAARRRKALPRRSSMRFRRRLASTDVLVMHVNMTVVLSFRHVDMLGNLMNASACA